MRRVLTGWTGLIFDEKASADDSTCPKDLEYLMASNFPRLLGSSKTQRRSLTTPVSSQKAVDVSADVSTEVGCPDQPRPEREVRGHIEAVGPDQIRSELEFGLDCKIYNAIPQCERVIRPSPSPSDNRLMDEKHMYQRF